MQGGTSGSSALDLAASRVSPAAAVERLMAPIEWAVLECVGLAAGGPAQGTHVVTQDGAHHHTLWGLQLVRGVDVARLSIVLAEVAQGAWAPAGPQLSQARVLPQLGLRPRLPSTLGLWPLPPTPDQCQHHLAQVEVVLPHVEGWQLHGTQVGRCWAAVGPGLGASGRSSWWFSGAETAPLLYSQKRPF